MNPESKHGTPWSDDELDVIVADYFAMLAFEIERRPYVKSHHSAVIMALLGRSHRSVEFKHQNISAVLNELGLPWIPGYIPKPNYQNAIFDAIERYLNRDASIMNAAREPAIETLEQDLVFVDPPVTVPQEPSLPKKLQALIRKFDPVERDRRNRSLGEAGEVFVLRIEQERLHKAKRSDLAQRVRWVAKEEGDGAGYDIYSFNSGGSERLIEVKTTNGTARTPFFLTRNEFDVASQRPTEWCIYRVHCFAQNPRIFRLHPPLESSLHLSTEVWRASL